MKKLLAVVLAAVMVLSLGVVAFAADGDTMDDISAITNDKLAVEGDLTTGKLYVKGTQDDVLASGTQNATSDITLYIPVSQITASFVAADDSALTGTGVTAKLADILSDGDLVRFSKKFEEGGKAVKSVKWVEEKVATAEGTGTGRAYYIEIKLNEDLTDEETKVELKYTFTTKENIEGKTGYAIKKGAKLTGDVVFYVENGEMRLDDTATVGASGYYAKAEKNEDNSLEWEDNNNTIAKLEFSANDDPDAFYPRMTTSWELAIGDSINNKNFEGTDAVVRAFRAAPVEIPCTSRASFYLYMPAEFGDDVDPADVAIYEVKDNEFVDVTSKFEYVETDEDGNDIDGFLTRTRTLGVYVICEKAVEETALVDGTPVPEKENPGTGRF
ncbi:hypothetical protein [Youxingia wuxianensis]|uniref:Uncharacterized protein n=1 Tax=Youxingia wuxianensis TaxID=2763678 RepID=A0A926II03_9FIRM|nr:hypothetical protein [Youxingia wuxianensis]MBC8586469.1 hypothetical protein [Youxingia wuxianensis]